MASRRGRWRRQMAELFDLPRDVVFDLPRISLVGDVQMWIQNHRGLLEYRTDLVVVAMRHGRLSVRGEELSIGTIQPEEITIIGRLRAIEFRR